ncbi:MAG: translocation/assembly module TamB domain-containing protein [Deinococcales bacterium]
MKAKSSLPYLLAFILLIAILMVQLWQSSSFHQLILMQLPKLLITQGYQLEAQTIKGRIGSRFYLEKATLSSRDFELEVEEAELSYQLWALLRRELPLKIKAKGLKLHLNMGNIIQPGKVAEPLFFKPIIKAFELEGGEVSLENWPYDVPDIRLRDIAVVSEEPLRLKARYDNPYASEVSMELFSLNPFGMIGDISVDARVGRYWWQELEGGKIYAQMRLNGGLEGVSIRSEAVKSSVIGIALDDIAAELEYRNFELEGSLGARALGTALSGHFQLNSKFQQWQATVSGQPKLSQVALWLSNNSLPLLQTQLDKLALSGSAQTGLELWGWDDFHLKGQAQGSGSMLEKPIESIHSEFSFSKEAGTKVQVLADWAGGNISYQLQPQDKPAIAGHNDNLLRAENLALWPAPFDKLLSDIDLKLSSQEGSSETELSIDMAGEALQRQLTAQIQGSARDQLWQFDLYAEDDLAENFEALATWDSETLKLEGDLTALKLPYLSQALDLKLQADGPLDLIQLTGDLQSQDPLSLPSLALSQAPLTALSTGQLSAQLSNLSQLNNLQLKAAGLSLSGDILFQNLAQSQLQFELQGASFLAPLQGNLAAVGDIELKPPLLRAEARAQDLKLGPLSLASSEGLLELDAEGLRYQAQDNLTFAISKGRLEAQFENSPISFLNERFQTRGRLDAPLEDMLAGLYLDLDAYRNKLSIRLLGSADDIDIRLTSLPGIALDSIKLPELYQAFEGEGKLKLREEVLKMRLATQAADPLQVDLEIAWQEDLAIGLEMVEGGARATTLIPLNPNPSLNTSTNPTQQTWQLSGQLNPLPLVAVFYEQIPEALTDPSLTLEGIAQLSPTNFVGLAQIQGAWQNQPFQLRLDGKTQLSPARFEGLAQLNSSLSNLFEGQAAPLALEAKLNGLINLTPLNLTGDILLKAEQPMADLGTIELESQFNGTLNPQGLADLPSPLAVTLLWQKQQETLLELHSSIKGLELSPASFWGLSQAQLNWQGLKLNATLDGNTQLFPPRFEGEVLLEGDVASSTLRIERLKAHLNGITSLAALDSPTSAQFAGEALIEGEIEQHDLGSIKGFKAHLQGITALSPANFVGQLAAEGQWLNANIANPQAFDLKTDLDGQLSLKGFEGLLKLSAQGLLGPFQSLSLQTELDGKGQFLAGQFSRPSFTGLGNFNGIWQGHRASGQLSGDGEHLYTEAEAVVSGLPFQLSGELYPSFLAEISLTEDAFAALPRPLNLLKDQLADISLTGPYDAPVLQDEGVLDIKALLQQILKDQGLEPLLAKLSLDPQPYAFRLDMGAKTFKATLGGSNLNFYWQEGRWWFEGRLEQPALYQTLNLNLSAHIQGHSQGDILTQGQLYLDNETISFSSDLEQLNVTGALTYDLANKLINSFNLPLDLSSLPSWLNQNALATSQLAFQADIDLIEQNYNLKTQLAGPLAANLDLYGPLNDLKQLKLQGYFSDPVTGNPLGLAISYQQNSFNLQADNFNPQSLESLLNLVNLAGIDPKYLNNLLTGSLSYQASGWQGGFRVLSPYLPNALELSIEGQQIWLEAQGLRWGEVELSLAGSVFPRLDVGVKAQVSDLLRAEGRLGGNFSDPSLQASLESRGFGGKWGRLEPQTFTLKAYLQEGLVLNIQQNSPSPLSEALFLEENAWSGILVLPISLANLPHELILDLSGELLKPQAEIWLTGPLSAHLEELDWQSWQNNETLSFDLNLDLNQLETFLAGQNSLIPNPLDLKSRLASLGLSQLLLESLSAQVNLYRQEDLWQITSALNLADQAMQLNASFNPKQLSQLSLNLSAPSLDLALSSLSQNFGISGKVAAELRYEGAWFAEVNGEAFWQGQRIPLTAQWQPNGYQFGLAMAGLRLSGAGLSLDRPIEASLNYQTPNDSPSPFASLNGFLSKAFTATIKLDILSKDLQLSSHDALYPLDLWLDWQTQTLKLRSIYQNQPLNATLFYADTLHLAGTWQGIQATVYIDAKVGELANRLRQDPKLPLRWQLEGNLASLDEVFGDYLSFDNLPDIAWLKVFLANLRQGGSMVKAEGQFTLGQALNIDQAQISAEGLQSSLRGEIWPELALDAVVDVAGLEFSAIGVRVREGGLELQSSLKDLNLTARFSQQLDYLSFNGNYQGDLESLLASLKLSDPNLTALSGMMLNLQSDLAWQSGLGYQGQAQISAQNPELNGHIEVLGQEALSFQGELAYQFRAIPLPLNFRGDLGNDLFKPQFQAQLQSHLTGKTLQSLQQSFLDVPTLLQKPSADILIASEIVLETSLNEKLWQEQSLVAALKVKTLGTESEGLAYVDLKNGLWKLDIKGPELSLSLEQQSQTLSLTAQLQELKLDLSPWLSEQFPDWLEHLSLSSHLSYQQGEALKIESLKLLSLDSPEHLLEAQLNYDGVWSGQGTLQGNLASLGLSDTPVSLFWQLSEQNPLSPYFELSSAQGQLVGRLSYVEGIWLTEGDMSLQPREIVLNDVALADLMVDPQAITGKFRLQGRSLEEGGLELNLNTPQSSLTTQLRYEQGWLAQNHLSLNGNEFKLPQILAAKSFEADIHLQAKSLSNLTLSLDLNSQQSNLKAQIRRQEFWSGEGKLDLTLGEFITLPSSLAALKLEGVDINFEAKSLNDLKLNLDLNSQQSNLKAQIRRQEFWSGEGKLDLAPGEFITLPSSLAALKLEGDVKFQAENLINPSLDLQIYPENNPESYLKAQLHYDGGWLGKAQTSLNHAALPFILPEAVPAHFKDWHFEGDFDLWTSSLKGDIELISASGLSVLKGQLSSEQPNNLQSWQALGEIYLDGSDLSLSQDLALYGDFELKEAQLSSSNLRVLSPWLEPLSLNLSYNPLQNHSLKADIYLSSQRLSLSYDGNRLALAEGISIDIDPVQISIRGDGGQAFLELSAFNQHFSSLLDPDPQTWLRYLKGIELRSGEASLILSSQGASLRNFHWQQSDLSLLLNAELDRHLQGSFSGEMHVLAKTNWPFRLPLLDRLLDGLMLQRLELKGNFDLNHLDFLATAPALRLEGAWQQGQALSLVASIAQAEERLDLRVEYRFKEHLQGEVSIQEVQLIWGTLAFNVTAALALDDKGLKATGQLEAFSQRHPFNFEMAWQQLASLLATDLSAYLPPQTDVAEDYGGSLNFADIDIAALGLIDLPKGFHLPLSGELRLLGDSLSLEGSSLLKLTNSSLPLSLNANLDLRNLAQGLSFSLRLEDNSNYLDLEGIYRAQALDFRSHFEYFPLDKAFRLFFPQLSPQELKIHLTASLSAYLPLAGSATNWQDAALDFVSEQIIVEHQSLSSDASQNFRENLRTEGNVSFSYQNRQLVLKQANLITSSLLSQQQIGQWQAYGQLVEDNLDLNLKAEQVDFGPLLWLIPTFSPFNLLARGNLDLNISGTLQAPIILVNANSLKVELFGSYYSMPQITLNIQDDHLKADMLIQSDQALKGELKLEAHGPLSLWPLDVAGLELHLKSERIDLPVFGELTAIDMKISHQGPWWWLDGQMQMGNTLYLKGALNPLNLQLQGENIRLRAPSFFVGDSQSRLLLNFSKEAANNPLSNYDAVSDDSVYVLRGEVVGQSVELNARKADGGPKRATPAFYEQILFDKVRLSSAENMRFEANFAEIELGAELYLGGSLARPNLSGEARLLRGIVRYGGKDFTLSEGVVSFESARGVYPLIRVSAYSSFDKARVLEPERFVAPGGNQFEVFLTLAGRFDYDAVKGYQLILEPDLSSNALIQDQNNPTSLQNRSLSQDELASLLTLGRIDFNRKVPVSALGESVGFGALDTAVDLLLVSELQKVIAEGLGLDVFQIRTSNLSSLLLGPNQQSDTPFGVSFRVGNYLSEHLFASYELGRFSGPQAYALSQRLELRYDDIFGLNRVSFSLSGGLNFPNDIFSDPIAELEFRLDYQLNEFTSIESSAYISRERQSIGFGVRFNW